ncbi:MAG: diguanylate cyclase [Candidatus Brocadiaceae bacterium]|nr:diguanylate cyclase [Candidatus Brocadiaceae bacterium]
MKEKCNNSIENSSNEISHLCTSLAGMSKKAKLFHTLLDTIPSPIFYKDVDGKYLGGNNCFAERIFGLPIEDIIGKTVFDFPGIITFEQAEVYRAADNEIFENPHIVQHYDYEAHNKTDGNVRQYRFCKAAYFNENHEVSGLVGVMLDITELKQSVITDGLTNLYNQKFFLEQLDREIRGANRDKHPLSVIVFDIDNFKRYNDTYDHVAGDKLLESIGSIVKNNVRNTDYACRSGGEEFSLILLYTKLEDAARKGEELRRVVKSETTRLSVQNILVAPVTISVGVSQYKVGQNLQLFRKSAEKKLYEAKNAGKDCVRF